MSAKPRRKTASRPPTSARAWAREVVGDIPFAGGHQLDAVLTAYASHVVANACLKVRSEQGADACGVLLDGLILSCAHVAAGSCGHAPSKILRDLADTLDETLDPAVRERANA